MGLQIGPEWEPTPASGPQAPFLQLLSALRAGRQAVGGRGLLVRFPGATTSRVHSL